MKRFWRSPPKVVCRVFVYGETDFGVLCVPQDDVGPESVRVPQTNCEFERAPKSWDKFKAR